MILTIIVCVAVAIVVCGSSRSVPWCVACVLCCAMAVTMAVRDVVVLAGLPFYPWQGPVIASFALIVLGAFTGLAALKVDAPIGLGAIFGRLGSGVAGLFVAGRRRRSLAADVRRKVRHYRIEVV